MGSGGSSKVSASWDPFFWLRRNCNFFDICKKEEFLFRLILKRFNNYFFIFGFLNLLLKEMGCFPSKSIKEVVLCEKEKELMISNFAITEIKEVFFFIVSVFF